MKKEELKSHSIIALNLQTVEDVEQVIRQCETLKRQMQGGSDDVQFVEQPYSFIQKVNTSPPVS